MDIITSRIGIDQKTFDHIRSHVLHQYGINLTLAKKYLVENRLFKRLRHFGFNDYAQYHDYLFSGKGKDELALLSDYLSTNKTYFYREQSHFEFFEKYLKNLQTNKSLSIWSAASSTGDEAYTLSILLNEHNDSTPLKKVIYSILGTDISTRVIKLAEEARYKYPNVKYLPPHLIKKYFKITVGERSIEQYQLNESAKKDVRFRKLNLIKEIHTINQKFDFIFCRNVLIYFESEVKNKVCDQLIDMLKPGGFLILGHCEGFICKSTDLKLIQPALFQKQ